MLRSLMNMRRSTLALPLLCALTACATSTRGGSAATPEPTPLRGKALAFVRAEIANFDGPNGPSQLHGSPGSLTISDGSTVAYDRYLLVGSTLQKERARDFDAFVERITAEGGQYFCVERRADGKPGKILVVADGKRVMVSTLQW